MWASSASWLPSAAQWHNYADVFATKGVQFGRWYWNSIFIAAWVTLLQVFTTSLAAFSFSRLSWPGRNEVFLLCLATMMLPGLVMMIPNHQIMIALGLVDSYVGLILPAAFSAFGTFLLRQFMLTIPASLDEAAEIDGASTWQVYWHDECGPPDHPLHRPPALSGPRHPARRGEGLSRPRRPR